MSDGTSVRSSSAGATCGFGQLPWLLLSPAAIRVDGNAHQTLASGYADGARCPPVVENGVTGHAEIVSARPVRPQGSKNKHFAVVAPPGRLGPWRFESGRRLRDNSSTCLFHAVCSPHSCSVVWLPHAARIVRRVRPRRRPRPSGATCRRTCHGDLRGGYGRPPPIRLPAGRRAAPRRTRGAQHPRDRGENLRPQVDGRSRRHDRAPPDSGAGAVQQDAVLHRPGRAARAGVRGRQEIRRRNQRAAEDRKPAHPGGLRADVTRPDVPGAPRRPRRPRRGGADGDAGTAEASRLRPADAEERQRDRRHRSGRRRADESRRPRGTGSVRSQVELVLREPRSAQRPVQVGREKAGAADAGARDARGRGPARDGQRRPREDRGRRRLPGAVLEADLHVDPVASVGRRAQRRRCGAGDSAQQPQTGSRAR